MLTIQAPPWQQQPIPSLTTCPNCGGDLLGDGYHTVIHCENADYDRVESFEPDANPIYCEEKENV